MKYLVRQYRPNYFSGFENAVYAGIDYDKIILLPFFDNFRHAGFQEFRIEPYSSGEHIITAYYENGKHFVAGFALAETSTAEASDGGLLRDNWRYKVGANAE